MEKGKKLIKAIITPVVSALLLVSFSQMALADKTLHLQKVGKDLINVRKGEWTGFATITKNGEKPFQHKLSICIDHPKKFMEMYTGALHLGGYTPPNCKLFLGANTPENLNFTFACVPGFELPLVAKKSIRDLLDDPNFVYSETKYNVYTGGNSSSIQFNYLKKVRVPAAETKKEQGKKNFKPVIDTKSISMSGLLQWSSPVCIKPEKVPTNKELRKEGESVPSSASLNKKLAETLK